MELQDMNYLNKYANLKGEENKNRLGQIANDLVKNKDIPVKDSVSLFNSTKIHLDGAWVNPTCGGKIGPAEVKSVEIFEQTAGISHSVEELKENLKIVEKLYDTESIDTGNNKRTDRSYSDHAADEVKMDMDLIQDMAQQKGVTFKAEAENFIGLFKALDDRNDTDTSAIVRDVYKGAEFNVSDLAYIEEKTGLKVPEHKVELAKTAKLLEEKGVAFKDTVDAFVAMKAYIDTSPANPTYKGEVDKYFHLKPGDKVGPQEEFTVGIFKYIGNYSGSIEELKGNIELAQKLYNMECDDTGNSKKYFTNRIFYQSYLGYSNEAAYDTALDIFAIGEKARSKNVSFAKEAEVFMELFKNMDRPDHCEYGEYNINSTNYVLEAYKLVD